MLAKVSSDDVLRMIRGFSTQGLSDVEPLSFFFRLVAIGVLRLKDDVEVHPRCATCNLSFNNRQDKTIGCFFRGCPEDVRGFFRQKFVTGAALRSHFLLEQIFTLCLRLFCSSGLSLNNNLPRPEVGLSLRCKSCYLIQSEAAVTPEQGLLQPESDKEGEPKSKNWPGLWPRSSSIISAANL